MGTTKRYTKTLKKWSLGILDVFGDVFDYVIIHEYSVYKSVYKFMNEDECKQPTPRIPGPSKRLQTGCYIYQKGHVAGLSTYNGTQLLFYKYTSWKGSNPSSKELFLKRSFQVCGSQKWWTPDLSKGLLVRDLKKKKQHASTKPNLFGDNFWQNTTIRNMKQNLQAISLDLFPSFHQGLFLLEVFKGPAPWDWTSDLRSSLMSWTICSDRFRYLDVDYCRYMG